MGQIIHANPSPRSQHMFLQKYFLLFDVVRCQMAETANTHPAMTDTQVMLVRYMHNAYLAQLVCRNTASHNLQDPRVCVPSQH